MKLDTNYTVSFGCDVTMSWWVYWSEDVDYFPITAYNPSSDSD